MKPTRRRFMEILGLGAVSSPLAAKAALDGEIMKSAGVLVGSMSVDPPQGPQAYSSMAEHSRHLIAASDYVRMLGVPAALDARLRDDARWIERLDPDIAAKRSWSMTFKFLVQRQRNYERAIERMKVAADRLRCRDALNSLLGFEWPW